MKALPTLVACAFLCLATAHGATSPKLVSAINRTSATGQGDSFTPVFSPDGRFMVFVSNAKNLATNGTPSPWLDVFLRDLETGNTELVSVNTSGLGGGNGDSYHPGVSSNGLFVTFASDASNLVAGDTNRYADVFMRDMTLGITTLVSVSTNGVEGGFGQSASPQISADGGRIVFETAAWNIFSNNTNRLGRDVAVYDRLARSNWLVTINAGATGSGTGPFGRAIADGPAISENGRFVIFHTDATNLVNGVSTPNGGVFVRDLDSEMTSWASTGVTNRSISSALIPPIVSANGRVFFSARDDAGNQNIVSYDVTSGNSNILATNIAGLLTSSMLKATRDGRYVAVATSNSISVVDSTTGSSEIVCGNGVMPELKAWRSPMISGNGQRVVFAGAVNLDGVSSAYVYDRVAGTRGPVSLNTNGTLAEITTFSEPVISDDGRRIAFESRASDLVAGDLNDAVDIFVRDLSDNTTHLVSAAAVPATAPALRSFLASRSISDLGRVIAFTSLDHSLAADSDNAWCSALVKDRVSGTNRVLSTAASRALGTNRLAFNPTISPNGRYVAWLEQPAGTGTATAATNIFWLDLQSGAERVAPCNPTYPWSPRPALSRDGRWLVFTATVPGNAYSQVFRRDMFTSGSTNELLSYKAYGSGPGTGDSYGPMLTPDGEWVVFASRASDVVTNFTQVLNTPQVVARRIATREARWINFAPFASTPGRETNIVISGNSRYVFTPGTTSSDQIYRQDLKNGGGATLVNTGVSSFSVSHAGDVMAYLGSGSDFNVYARDLRTAEVELISTNAAGCCGAGGSARSYPPLISGDGRYVIFASAATNLVAGDTNGATDLFVHDRVTHTTMLVSRNASGAPGTSSSSSPVLGPDGRTVVFTSSARDLVAGDFNNTRDILVLRLGGEDSDLDGMDDDWEFAYFNALARDGTGDFDGDGASDAHEFQAATDPTNQGSVFRALTVTSTGENSREVIWQSEAGRRYRVEYKDRVDEEFWEELGMVTAAGTSASLNDPAAETFQRIYRVVALP